MKESKWKWASAVLVLALLASWAYFAACVNPKPEEKKAGAVAPAPAPAEEQPDRDADQELAYLLVKLELKTRSVMAEHYVRNQSGVPGANILYQRYLVKNLILPAAVAGNIFSETVPASTGGRAWVKMVVPEPRNPKNRGDETALKMLDEIKGGAPNAELLAGGAHYYGEPIKTKAPCLRCHGEPRGDPDPSFPQYKKDGWKEGETIGAVIARVAPK